MWQQQYPLGWALNYMVYIYTAWFYKTAEEKVGMVLNSIVQNRTDRRDFTNQDSSKITITTWAMILLEPNPCLIQHLTFIPNYLITWIQCYQHPLPLLLSSSLPPTHQSPHPTPLFFFPSTLSHWFATKLLPSLIVSSEWQLPPPPITRHKLQYFGATYHQCSALNYLNGNPQT